MSVLARPQPSRIELIRLRRQLVSIQRLRRVIEDARNSTIQRLKGIITELEAMRGELAPQFAEISRLFKVAVAKMGIERADIMALLVPKESSVRIVDRGLFYGLELEKVSTAPTYSLMGDPVELDEAITRARELAPKLIEYADRLTTFFVLLRRVAEYQRMLNALDNVVIPRLRELIAQIRLMLDEQEREEFARRHVITKTLAQR